MFIAHRRAGLLAALVLSPGCASASSGADPASPPRPAPCSPEAAFGEGWTAPVKLGGLGPVLPEGWTPPLQNRPARLRCLITLEGTTSGCEIIEAPRAVIPAILDAASTWRFSPATCLGTPVAVKSELGFALTPPPPSAPPVTSSIPPAVPHGVEQGAPAPGTARLAGGFIPFGEGTERPRLISGRQPAYTQKARDAAVEGMVMARCLLMTTGALHDCVIIQSVPLMDQEVLDALATQRYAPATFHGTPINVSYTLRFRFALH